MIKKKSCWSLNNNNNNSYLMSISLNTFFHFFPIDARKHVCEFPKKGTLSLLTLGVKKKKPKVCLD